ncbi:hypothetical protein HU200_020052 [Digitaria exilis]|uniref:Uncharacterized protein n=1 Tax=Digitaria exilis TaxID=1010633 RepID=A0A835F173_9POAL|nr:hypothetical protein HU200_020052 [Digitaria exilis]
MSDDEPYDSDGDVIRYLSCHSPEAHLFSLSEPLEATLGGLFHSAAPTINNGHVQQGNPAAAPPLEALPAPEIGVQAPITGVHGQPAPDFGVQFPATEHVQGHPAPSIMTGMEIDTLVAPEKMTQMMQQAYGAFPNPTPPIQHGGGVHGEDFHQAPIMDSQHFQAPTINSEHRVAPPINGEHHQEVPGMAMLVDQPETNTMAPEAMMQMMQQAYGGFPPDPTPPMQQGGVDAAYSLLAGDSSMLPPPSPTIYTMLDELAAMLEAGGVDMGNDGGAAEARDDARGVFATANAEEEDVVFEPIVRGQLDCARCLPTREILDDIGEKPPPPNALYFAAANLEEADHQPVQAEENTDAPPSVVEEVVTEAAQAAGVVTQAQENTTDAPPSVAEAAATTEAAPPESTQPSASQEQQNNAGAAPPVTDVPAPVPEAAEPAATSRAQNNTNAGENFAAFNWEGFKPEILESSEVQPYDPASGVSVLLYPSLLEQLRQQELKRQERTRLSNMAVNDTPDYLNINDDHLANAPNFASETFRLLCLRDPTYRLYKTRVTGLCRKIKKLEQKGTQVGTGGLFAIKQKMESFKLEKEKIYATIKRAMQGDNGNRNDVAAATSNNNGEVPSNNNAEPPSHDAEGPSSNGAATSNKKAKGPAAPSSAAAGPSATK